MSTTSTDPRSRNPVKADLPLDEEGARPDGGEAAATPASDSPAPTTPPAGGAPGEEADPALLEQRIIAALKTVYDPEIPVNIYELGLIYDVAIRHDDRHVHIKMTLTSPACPVAGTLPGEVERAAASAAGVDTAEVELVWDPAWDPSMMSEAARLELGMF